MDSDFDVENNFTIDVLPAQATTKSESFEDGNEKKYNNSKRKIIEMTQKLTLDQKRKEKRKKLTKNCLKQILDERFYQMKLRLQNDPQDMGSAEKWVGELLRISVKEAYDLYYKNGKENEMRLAFSTTIIDNYRRFIIEGSLIPKINLKTIQKVFKQSSDNTVEYLQCKYHSSNNKVIDLRLGDEIKETDKTIDPSFDMLRRSGTTLSLHSETQLRYTIKLFLNKLIIECQKNQEMFKKYVTQIFDVDGSNELHYEIGSKIKMSTRPYSQQELREPGFSVKGNEIMRVMMKWIEQLIDFFKKQRRILKNKAGFRISTEEQMKKLSFSQREGMQNRFKKQYQKSDPHQKEFSLNIKLSRLQDQIRSTISRIVLASQNQVQKTQFLDKDIISMLIISEHIWKGLENYMMDVLVTILTSFYNIKMSYYLEGMKESDLQVHTFTLGDLMRCKCSGTRDQIIKVYKNLQEKQRRKEIRILRVKNRLNQQTADFLVNFAFQDQSKCFLICQMQIALTKKSKNDDRGYNFDHFLYEMARSPHGISVQLAVMLYTLDNRKSYMLNHDLSFKSTNTFHYDDTNRQISCSICPKNQKQTKVNLEISSKKSYMCNNCCKLIQAYKFYLNGLSCNICQNTICPECYLRILKTNNQTQINFPGFDKISKYFTPLNKPYIIQKSNDIKKVISQYFEKNELNFLAILYFKNYRFSKQFVIIKKLPNTDYYVTTFSNQFFKLKEELEDSIVYLMKPQLQAESLLRVDYLNSLQKKKTLKLRNREKETQSGDLQIVTEYECIQASLHDKFSSKRDSDYWVLRNKTDDRRFIIDYSIKEATDFQKDISDNKMKQLVQSVNNNKSNSQNLILIKMQDPQRLRGIKKKQNITSIQIQQAYTNNDVSNTAKEMFYFINQFPKVINLALYYTPSYQHCSFALDQILQELIINHCQLDYRGIPNNLIYPSLLKLDLSKNNLTAVPSFQFPCIQSIDVSNNLIQSITQFSHRNLPHLKRLILKDNHINILTPLKFPNLQVLNLQNNRIISFSSLLSFQTTNLKKINLSKNKTQNQKLVPIFNNLDNLTDLILSFSGLTSFHLVTHPKIKTLKLDHNSLKQIPELKMPNLKHLDLSFNNFTSEQNIGRLVSNLEIQTLQLIGNDLQKIPHIKPKSKQLKVRTSMVLDPHFVETIKQQKQFFDSPGYYQCVICSKIINTLIMWFNQKNKSTVCDNKQCLHQASLKELQLIKIMDLGKRPSNISKKQLS